MAFKQIVTISIIIQLLFASIMTMVSAYFPPLPVNANVQGLMNANKTLAQAQALNQSIRFNSPVSYVSLLFNSGNLLINFVMNFFFAFPNIATLLLSALFMVAPVQAQIQGTILTVVWVGVFTLYLFIILNALLSLWGSSNINKV